MDTRHSDSPRGSLSLNEAICLLSMSNERVFLNIRVDSNMGEIMVDMGFIK